MCAKKISLETAEGIECSDRSFRKFSKISGLIREDANAKDILLGGVLQYCEVNAKFGRGSILSSQVPGVVVPHLILLPIVRSTLATFSSLRRRSMRTPGIFSSSATCTDLFLGSRFISGGV